MPVTFAQEQSDQKKYAYKSIFYCNEHRPGEDIRNRPYGVYQETKERDNICGARVFGVKETALQNLHYFRFYNSTLLG